LADESAQQTGLSRRRFLAGLGVAAAGAVVGGGGVAIADAANAAPASGTVPFYGRYQAGITTDQQDRLCFAAFDFVTSSRDDVIAMLKDWTTAAEAMCAGRATGSVAGDVNAPPDDTGEALGLSAANLTLTFGFGSSFFSQGGVDRFGVAGRKPAALVDIPPFKGDELDPGISDGDMCVQACADDPQVAFHAVRNLARIGRGTVVMRWNQLGFGRTATTSRTQSTPRNLMGMKDGTDNLRAQDTDLLNQNVWVGSNSDQAWMTNGTYLVSRRIRMLIEVWDRAGLGDQESTIGRTKLEGAPLGKTHEKDPVDLNATNAAGLPQIPAKAHIRLAAPSTNNGKHILRRGYSFTDGMDQLGTLDAGLFFIAFQNDPRTHFIPIQQKLSQNDALNEYIQHTSSALFAVPGGWNKGEYIGQRLFAA
jgi:deferrochelatase/peroxidase EfeB